MNTSSDSLVTIATIIGIIAAIIGIPAAIAQVWPLIAPKLRRRKPQTVVNQDAPVRIDFLSSGDPFDCIIKDFDPNRNLNYYLKGGKIVFSYPAISIDVTSLVRDEWIKIAKFLAIQITNTEQIQDAVDYFVTPRGGAGGKGDEFLGFLTSYQDKICGAPTDSNVDYFTLQPGEKEVFRLIIGSEPGFYFQFQVGVIYSYKGTQHTQWIPDSFVIGYPKEARCWKLSYDHSLKFDMDGNFVRCSCDGYILTEEQVRSNFEWVQHNRETIRSDPYFQLPPE